jgi:hypothetical protein
MRPAGCSSARCRLRTTRRAAGRCASASGSSSRTSRLTQSMPRSVRSPARAATAPCTSPHGQGRQAAGYAVDTFPVRASADQDGLQQVARHVSLLLRYDARLSGCARALTGFCCRQQRPEPPNLNFVVEPVASPPGIETQTISLVPRVGRPLIEHMRAGWR